MIRLLAGLAFLTLSLVAQAETIPVAELDDTVNPGTAAYLIRAIDEAEKANAPALVIRIDTPGGLLTSTRQIIQRMLAAKIPILVFVGPSGARAGSAGALIALAADVLGMAPGTNLGAAHPVNVDGSTPEAGINAKIENDTAAFAESVAKARGRNSDWAIRAVRKSESIPPDRALAEKVIDIIAVDMDEFLTKAAGFTLRVPRPDRKKLPEELGKAQTFSPTLKERVVTFFANPTIAYLILAIGGLCLFLELTHPGAIVPGVVGAICLILSLVSFQFLPISGGALALLLVGMGLLLVELFVPAFGIFGIGGITCFVLGSLFLVDSTAPEMQLSLALVLPTAFVLAAVTLGLGFLVARTRNRKPAIGVELLTGTAGEVCETFSSDGRGQILVQGERWTARTTEGGALKKGTQVRIERVEGLTVWVRPEFAAT